MSEATKETVIRKVKIDGIDIYLENFEKGEGKIIITNSFQGKSYSFYWGAMGDTLEEFLIRIDNDYFAGKLMNSQSSQSFDVKRTFASIRKFIKEELDLPFWKHMEFQQHMRKTLKDFQDECEEVNFNSQGYFVNNFFSSFVDRLDYYKIGEGFHDWERTSVQADF